jgi:uncharacterized membrane protein (GlpM family)
MKRKTKIICLDQKQHKKSVIFLVFAGVAFVLIAFLSQEAGKSISEEDGLIENITTFILLATTALGLLSALRQNSRKGIISFISFISFLAFLSELSFGERIFNLDMPHAGGKQLDGVHDLLHMLQKIYIVNYNYHPAETTATASALITLAVLTTYAARKRILRLNMYLKELKIRYIVFSAIAFAMIAQILDLNIAPYKNYRFFEEILELLSAACLFITIFKIKSTITSLPANKGNN